MSKKNSNSSDEKDKTITSNKKKKDNVKQKSKSTRAVEKKEDIAIEHDDYELDDIDDDSSSKAILENDDDIDDDEDENNSNDLDDIVEDVKQSVEKKETMANKEEASSDKDKEDNITPSSTEKEVKQELSEVARNPKQNIVIVIVVLIILGFIGKQFFFSNSTNSEKPTSVKVARPDVVVRPSNDYEDKQIPSIPTLPSPPELDEISPPVIEDIALQDDTELMIPDVPDIANLGAEQQSLADAESSAATDNSLPSMNLDANYSANKNSPPPLPVGTAIPKVQEIKTKTDPRREAKIRSSMILFTNNSVLNQANESQVIAKQNDSDRIVQTKSADNIPAVKDGGFRYRGDMSLLLGKGKVIDVVTETAIDTDFGGEIRAVVTNDVYSEAKKNILIPKGSRVFGTYATNVDEGYARVSIAWNGIDLINGYSIAMNADMVDNLGRKGAKGRYDDKFKEQFFNTVLQSAFNITLAKNMNKIVTPRVTRKSQSNDKQVIINMQKAIQDAKSQFTGRDEAEQTVIVNNLCDSVRGVIFDKASEEYKKIDTKCTAVVSDTYDIATKFQAIVDTINDSTASIASTTAANSQEDTQEQKAALDAYKAVTDLVSNKINKTQNLKPTVTIGQGALMKIYVKRDYIFPKEVIYKK